MIGWWTLSRAVGTGAVAGLAALILWPAYAAWQEPLKLPYIAALALAAFCGASILTITAADWLFHERRGKRIQPIRAFDIIMGIVLTIPPAIALCALLGLG